MLSHFRQYNKKYILSLTHVRKFETKLGECVLCMKETETLEESIKRSEAEYVLMGIPEDIGVKANLGMGGADSCWFPFLDAFLNIQSNDFLSGENIFVAGHFDFNDIKNIIKINASTDDEKIAAYRHAVNTIDDEVEELVKIITQYRKIPLIIGGGHNNAYPALKGAAKGLHKAEVIPLAQINCINLDAHADYRPMEGRHSGNAFRYADEDGYLDKYCIIGLHENYLQQNVWIDMVNNPFIDCITYEDIFIHEKRNFLQAIAHAAAFTGDNYAGIEIDLDAVENVLASAATPSGLTALQIRRFVNYIALNSKTAYLHIAEGAMSLESGESSNTTGKLISYIVSDFVKAHNG
jgi:formiminoglutamase